MTSLPNTPIFCLTPLVTPVMPWNSVLITIFTHSLPPLGRRQLWVPPNGKSCLQKGSWEDTIYKGFEVRSYILRYITSRLHPYMPQSPSWLWTQNKVRIGFWYTKHMMILRRYIFRILQFIYNNVFWHFFCVIWLCILVFLKVNDPFQCEYLPVCPVIHGRLSKILMNSQSLLMGHS